MSAQGYKVTVEDLDTGETTTTRVARGDYLLLTFEPCHDSHHVTYGNGVAQITIRDHQPEFAATTDYLHPTRQDGDAPPPDQERRRE